MSVADDPIRGIYVPVDDRWPKHFQGLGVRIEDSVCVQEDAPLILTTEAIKEVRHQSTSPSGFIATMKRITRAFG